MPKIRQLVDYSIELESFAGSERETHPAFKEYSGLLHLHKMTALNTLAVHMPETTDLAFKLRRKKFVIEKMHLPPGKRTHSDSIYSIYIYNIHLYCLDITDLQEVGSDKPTTMADLVAAPKCSSGMSINSNVSMDF